MRVRPLPCLSLCLLALMLVGCGGDERAERGPQLSPGEERALQPLRVIHGIDIERIERVREDHLLITTRQGRVTVRYRIEPLRDEDGRIEPRLFRIDESAVLETVAERPDDHRGSQPTLHRP